MIVHLARQDPCWQTGRVSASFLLAVSSKLFQLNGGQLHHDRLSVLKSARCLAPSRLFGCCRLLLSRQPCSPTARRAQRPAQRWEPQRRSSRGEQRRWRPQGVRVRGQRGFRRKGQARREQRGQRQQRGQQRHIQRRQGRRIRRRRWGNQQGNRQSQRR